MDLKISMMMQGTIFLWFFGYRIDLVRLFSESVLVLSGSEMDRALM